ncbi:Protein-S-isoprenylcysteine O-methyltransferase Ste14 [Pararobbsia alpina]|uniref:methyltransferase family protein n=1 Tax=Pararobbsia alpina TaxID=621374 RepID=UPI0039A43842
MNRNQRASLFFRAWLSVAALGLIMGVLLFVGAGTLSYVQGWVYWIIFVGASAWTTDYLIHHDPALLERRMRGGPFAEGRGAQRVIMTLASVGFIGLIVVPALDYRWGYPLRWTHTPFLVECAGVALVCLGFLGIYAVYRVNTFASATVQVADEQKVVTTGLYGWVRHPMYATASLMLIGSPLTLGSWLGIAVFAVVVPTLIWRLLDEERLLKQTLAGYSAYCEQVRWRLIPYVF